MNRPFPLIIFKHTVNPKFPPEIAKQFEGSYNAGWFLHDSKSGHILQWGNCKNKAVAKGLMNDVLLKQGEREVLFYDKEIPVNREKAGVPLTMEICEDILANAERWHS